MSKFDDFEDDDDDSFRKAMADVKPLKPSSKLNHPSQRHKIKVKNNRISTHHGDDSQIKLSDFEAQVVSHSSFLSYKQDGVQAHYFRKLKQGHFVVEAQLDLHGYTIDQARSALINFIESALSNKLRVVRIIHGKGFRGKEFKPLLKNKVNSWLKQLPMILAFSSCLPKDGGTGAVYVLLRR